MPTTIITCNQYFAGFQDPENKYKTLTLSDFDDCYPNGTVTIQWVKATSEYCPNAIVTNSTGDYAYILPVGTRNMQYFYNTSAFNIIESDTFAYFWSTCAPYQTIKISISLSDLVDTDLVCV